MNPNNQLSFSVNQVADVWIGVEKYLHGKIIALGGKTRTNVHLEMETGESITISASRELLVQEEKNRLYREAVLHVSAQENLATGELRNMQLIGFEPYHSRYDEDAFKLMVERGTKAWADVPDSDEWLESIRGNRT
jgi:hypothetical protein